jgi:hypothetical protein
VPARSPPPRRWTLRTLRGSVRAVADDRLRGIGRVRQRCRRRRRTARLQRYRPDPDSLPKVAQRERCLRAAAREPGAVALGFVDARGA